jgi:phosphoglycolate phosphatase-like HAD superfamily hydrolase
LGASVLNIARYAAVVLDFDGVLVDSNELKRQSFFDIWEAGGAFDDIVRDVLSGPGDRFSYIKEIHRRITQGQPLAADADHFIQAYTRRVEEGIISLGPGPGAVPFLRRLAGKLVFINSATPEETLSRIVDAIGLASYINEARGLPKSKGEIFADLTARYALRSEDMVFIGDTMSDLKAAREAGVAFIGIASRGGDLSSGMDVPVCSGLDEMVLD